MTNQVIVEELCAWRDECALEAEAPVLAADTRGICKQAAAMSNVLRLDGIIARARTAESEPEKSGVDKYAGKAPHEAAGWKS